jgi:hypothetical protein
MELSAALKECSATLKKEKGGSNRARKRTKKGTCFWFTGSSGTGVRQALTALKKGFEADDRHVQIVSIEDELIPAFAEYTYPSDPKKRQAYQLELQKKGGFKQILNESPKVVSKLWHRAARHASSKARAAINKGTDVFLTFHAAYHADKFGDFYSPVDPRLLLEFPKPRRFICFIDDIGDVASRLRREGQVFSNRSKTGLASVIEAIRDLLTVLEWRATELTVSRLLGSLVGCDPFVLAVKHPVRTAVRVLLGDGRPAYISHSISEPRRTWERTKSWPPFMNEVQRFTNKLSKPDLGISPEALIPICPTSIDERRIASSRTVAGTELLVPLLNDRWETATEEILVLPPENGKEANKWLDPCGYFDASKLAQDKIPSGLEPDLLAVNGLLQALRTRIDNQINARDHTLVSQCPFFVVYRPYEAWRVTGGVAAEIRHRERLKKEGKTDEKTIFLHSVGDDDRRKLGVIAEECASFFRWIVGTDEVGTAQVITLLMEKLTTQPPASYGPQDIADRVKILLDQTNIKYGGPRFSGDNAVLGKVTSADTEKKADDLWKQISLDAMQTDSWKASADVWYVGKNLTPESFAEKVNELARKDAK